MAIAASTAIALGIGAASAGSSIYSTKTAGKQNRRTLEAQERESTRALDYEKASMAEQARIADAERAEAARVADAKLAAQAEERATKERIYREQLAHDQRRWDDYVRVRSPMWNAGNGVLQQLSSLMGYHGGGAAPSAMPAAGSPPPSSAAGSGLAGGDRSFLPIPEGEQEILGPWDGVPHEGRRQDPGPVGGGRIPSGPWGGRRPGEGLKRRGSFITGASELPTGGSPLAGLMQLAQLAQLGQTRTPPTYAGT
jgi:hypothetical protein